MKKSILISAFMSFVLSIQADDYSYLNVETTDGTVISLDASSLSMSFSNGYLMSGSKKVASLSDLTKMYFSNEKGSELSDDTDVENITISSAGQATFSSQYDLDFTDVDELKAYIATGYDKTSGTIWLTRVNSVPAKTGILIIGEEGDYDIPKSEAASYLYYKNLFKYTLENITLQATDGDYTNYYLSNGASGVGFYKVTDTEGVELSANRAYLSVPTEIQTVGTAGQTETISVSTALQVPYYPSQSLDFTSMEEQGVKAYTATGYDYSKGTIWLTRVKKVPAETGILIIATTEGDYDVPTAEVASVYDNMFKGSLTAQTIQATETIDGTDYINYYLSNGDAGVGFYKVTEENGVSLDANRCYLPIPERETAGTRGIGGNSTNSYYSTSESDDVIGIRLYGTGDGLDGTTGINTIENSYEPDVYYNLQGQRVDNPGKGLYIKNGKKIIIK